MTPNYDTCYFTPRFPGCDVERFVAEKYDIREISYDFYLFCPDYFKEFEDMCETREEDEV